MTRTLDDLALNTVSHLALQPLARFRSGREFGGRFYRRCAEQAVEVNDARTHFSLEYGPVYFIYSSSFGRGIPFDMKGETFASYRDRGTVEKGPSPIWRRVMCV